MSHIQPIANATPAGIALERRSKPRLQVAYPALVRGNDSLSGKFREDALVENVSAGGVYLRLKRVVVPGNSLFITLRFSNLPPKQTLAPCLAARGIVLRVDQRQDGTYGVALKFQNYRFLDCNECDCKFKNLSSRSINRPKEVLA